MGRCLYSSALRMMDTVHRWEPRTALRINALCVWLVRGDIFFFQSLRDEKSRNWRNREKASDRSRMFHQGTFG